MRAVGIDRGYIRLGGHGSRLDGWFEVVAGKSLPDDRRGHSFAYVHKLEDNPADCMLAFLAREGVARDQPVIFLADGGERVRRAQIDCGESVLDWFSRRHAGTESRTDDQGATGMRPQALRRRADQYGCIVPTGTSGTAALTRH